MPKKMLASYFLILFLVSCKQVPTPIFAPTAEVFSTTGMSLPKSNETLLPEEPEWLNDNKSNILLLSYGKLTIFIDPVTTDTLFLEISDAHWVDNTHILFASNDRFLYNSSEGNSQDILDLANWKIIEAKYNPNQSSGVASGNEKSPNIWLDKNEENTPLKIYNDQRKQWDIFLYPPQGLYNLNELFIEGKIFIVQGNAVYRNGYVIAVYDFESKKIIKTFVGNVEKNTLRYSKDKVIYVTDNIPCAIDIQTLKRACGVLIPRKYKDIEIGWSPNYPETIPFTYSEHIDKYAYTKKVCLFGFFTGEIVCPMEDLQILKPVLSNVNDWRDPSKQMEIIESKSIWDYSISPNKKYILFCYGNNYYARYEGTAIVDIDGSNFRLLDDIEEVPISMIANTCWQSDVGHVAFSWRPLP
jgi:hypothetical protein